MFSIKYITEFLTIFALTLFVSIGVTVLWSLIFHGAAIVDWGSSFRFAIILAILLPFINNKRGIKSVK